MGFLGIGNYSKPGKGVSKNAPEKKRFFLFFDILFRKFWKIIQLNLLYLVAYIPLVLAMIFVFPLFNGALPYKILAGLGTAVAAIPIGPATAGLTYILRNYAREQHAFMLSDFWDAVKNNWKQSVPTGIIMILLGIIVYFSISFYFLNISASTLFTVMFGITIAVALILLFASYYVYLLIVTVDLKLIQLYRNSLILAVLGLRTNLITTFFAALILVPVILFFPFSLILVLLIVPALIGLIVNFNSFQYIKKYCIDPYYDKQKEENPDIAGEKPDDAPVFSDESLDSKKD